MSNGEAKFAAFKYFPFLKSPPEGHIGRGYSLKTSVIPAYSGCKKSPM